MKEARTAAIAGAGIIGLSIAWRLAQRGWHVDIFDRGEIGREASWAGAGMLAPGGEIDQPSPLGDLAIESRRLYSEFVRELEQSSGLPIDYQECGALDLAYSSEEWRDLEARATRQAEAGIQSKSLSAWQVKTFWPPINSEHLAGARFYPDDAIVNPREVVAALTVACERLNVKICSSREVESMEVSDRGVAIETAGSPGMYDVAVIASGAWSGAIPVSGVLPLPASQPVKGHLIGYQQPAQTCGTIVRHGHTYLLQRANGLLIAGASVEHVGFDRRIDGEQTARLAAKASFVLPHLRETSPTETWAGFRPESDRLRIGAWQSTRLFLAYGHYRNGILLAPLTAASIAREIEQSALANSSTRTG